MFGVAFEANKRAGLAFRTNPALLGQLLYFSFRPLEIEELEYFIHFSSQPCVGGQK